MKIKSILCGIAAVLTATACSEETFSVKDPVVTTSQTVCAVEGTAAGTLQFTFNANLPWHIEVSPANAASAVNDLRRRLITELDACPALSIKAVETNPAAARALYEAQAVSGVITTIAL